MNKIKLFFVNNRIMLILISILFIWNIIISVQLSKEYAEEDHDHSYDYASYSHDHDYAEEDHDHDYADEDHSHY